MKKKSLPVATVPYKPRQFPPPSTTSDGRGLRPDTAKLLPLDKYDYIIVSFSGGKDSVACALHLLELGVDPKRIELWHQCVDGQPGKSMRLWDWPCTESYCEAFAKAFGMRMLFQWKVGGYTGEMLRYDMPTAAVGFERLDGSIAVVGGDSAKINTRMKFPQMSADLSTRWCSAYLKIDVAARAINNDPRFEGKKTLLITGERRQESANRSTYATVEAHKSSGEKRRVDQWRPVIGWFEQDVWEIMERYRVRPHPAYYLGWSRVSCLPCIFGNPAQWAAVRELSPGVFKELAEFEENFAGFHGEPYTLRRDGSLTKIADKGVSFVAHDPVSRKLALAEHYPAGKLIVPRSEKWALPVGAYGHSGGPT